MTIPNQLTLARLFLCGLLILVLSIEWQYSGIAALLLFTTAVFTDWLDGYLARKWNQISDFGKLMDPLADKILVTTVFISFVAAGMLPMWMVVLVLFREFLITGLRGLAGSKGVVLPAEKLGKYKTISQMACAFTGLLFLATPEQFWADVFPVLIPLFQILAWLMLALTLFSGLTYCVRNRNLFV